MIIIFEYIVELNVFRFNFFEFNTGIIKCYVCPDHLMLSSKIHTKMLLSIMHTKHICDFKLKGRDVLRDRYLELLPLS